MDMIPAHIEQLIADLPIVPFSAGEAFEAVIQSDAFSTIFEYYSIHHANPKLQAQAEVYRRVSLYIYLTNQDDSFLESTEDLLYYRPVPSITEFLDSPKYMGLQNGMMYPYWRKQMIELFDEKSMINRVLWTGCTGSGKGCTVDTILPTPTGYRRAGDIKVGDLLWGRDGKPTAVEGVYPQGEKQSYFVNFNDGTSAHVDGSHLWEVVKGSKRIVRNTEWLYTHKASQYNIDICQPVEYTPKALPLDPYELGALLCETNAEYIPAKCMIGSIEQRLEFLRGVMDTAGQIVSNKIIYRAPSEKLAKEVAELVRSLGGMAQLSTEHEYEVQIWMSLNPFKLTRKAELFKPRVIKKKIVSVVQDVMTETVCFSVAAEDHLFLMNDYIVTHNTVTARKAVIYSLYKLLCLRYPRSVLNVEPASTLAVFILSVTQKNAYQTNFEPFLNILGNMPCFQKVRSMNSFANFDVSNPDCPIPYFLDKSNMTIIFINNIILTIGSQISNTVGYDIVISACFAPDTKIVIEDKSYNIKDLADNPALWKGKYTKTLNADLTESTGEIVACAPTAVVDEVMRIYTTETDYVECTLNHKWPVLNPADDDPDVFYHHGLPCKYAKDLTEDDELIPLGVQPTMKIFKVERIQLTEPKQMYNLTIDSESHTIPIEISPTCHVFSKNCDEINEAGVEKGMELLNSIDGRLDSRFAGSPYTFQNVMSSARSATASVTREYLKKWQHDAKFKVFNPMRFEVKESAEFRGDGTTFPVLIGNGVLPSQIIENDQDIADIEADKFVIPTGCELVKVPMIYKPLFMADLQQQIQDTLGIDTQDTPNVFRDTSKLQDLMLLPEMNMDATLNENTSLMELLPAKMFGTDILGKTRLVRAPMEPRYIHLDLAGDGQCDAALCMLHKEWKYNEITRVQDTMYVVDLMLFVNSKMKLDLEAIQRFCKELVTEKGVIVRKISADQFQSKIMLDNFTLSGLFDEVAKVSVDTKLEPYTNAATLIESGRVAVGHCPKLKGELEALVLDKGKVTRTTDLKDGPDALVGAIYNAQTDYYSVPQIQYTTEKKVVKTMDYADFLLENESHVRELF